MLRSIAGIGRMAMELDAALVTDIEGLASENASPQRTQPRAGVVGSSAVPVGEEAALPAHLEAELARM